MSAAKQISAKKLMPLWIGLGVLAVVASVVCIWLYGGGKYSGARLKEVNNDDVMWSGSPTKNSPTDFFYYAKIDLSGAKVKLLQPDFRVTRPLDEKDNSKSIWDETTSSFYQLDEGSSENGDPGGGMPGGGMPGGGMKGGGMKGGGMKGGGAGEGESGGGAGEGESGGGAGEGEPDGGESEGGGGQMPGLSAGAGVATDDNGTKLTARIVEYDSDNNKICEVIVVNGKLHGPGYIWDSEGRLLHKAEFKEGQRTGTSTIKTYDDAGNETFVRKLWWSDVPRLSKEQVYRNGKILWEAHLDERGAVAIIKRWLVVKTKKALDEEGEKVLTPKRDLECVELIKISRSYQKLKLEEKNIHGLPKEKDTGFAEFTGMSDDGKKIYKKPIPPPTYGELKEYFADTPWEKALLEKLKALNLDDEDSPYMEDNPKDADTDMNDPSAMGP